jgi:hypothetical protein
MVRMRVARMVLTEENDGAEVEFTRITLCYHCCVRQDSQLFFFITFILVLVTDVIFVPLNRQVCLSCPLSMNLRNLIL